MAQVRRYITAAGPAKKLLLDDILSVPDAETIIFNHVFGTDMRACLRLLADAARRKKSREILKPLVIKNADQLLAISDAKARKTASVLIGLAAPNECAQKLAGALKTEQTRFVRPSLILALGNTDNPTKFLRDYSIEPGEAKHVREEETALKKALASARPRPQSVVLSLPDTVTITSVHKKALLAELDDLSVSHAPNRVIDDAFDITASALPALRCYGDALYYIGTLHEPATAAKLLDSFGCRGLAYRVEAGRLPSDQRRDIIKQVSTALFTHGYIDNPSAYSFEIRVVKNALFFSPLADARFAYRVRSLPASINPAVAASIIRLILPYMRPEADVLDPFCGSGVMLIERALRMSAYIADRCRYRGRCDTGRNRQPKRKAVISISLLLKTRYPRLQSDGQYDEIVSNMPFGIRVSDHKSNMSRYTVHFFDKLDTLLRPGGFAFLFTQEKKLLRGLVERASSLQIIQVHRFETGGLNPNLYIIQKELSQ